jgi:hypothetical protein
MADRIQELDWQQRFAEKERSRRSDEEALASGAKTSAQLKRDNEAFAFPAGRARIDWESARSRF